jgi:ABC-2 type transport system ATP-binding protein
MILQVSEVVQTFRTGFWMKKTEVLHGISLEVPKHSIFGFLGANGAGKTTLIQLICGLRRPSAGRILIDGREAATPEARARIGYLPERPYFPEHLTGEQLLHYFGALSGMARSDVNARIPGVLEAVNMSHARKLELKKYSKGMLQRIGIAQAILHDPEFLVLDEPMSGLDPLGRKEMRELIVRLAAQGKTVFFSTHVIPDVEAVCDQVALIRKGTLVGSGSISKFVPKETSKIEIVFSGIALEQARSAGAFVELREIPEGVRAALPGAENLEEVLERLIHLKGRIHWVNPVRPSLEDQFGEAYR